MAAQREWFEKDYYAVLGVSSNAAVGPERGTFVDPGRRAVLGVATTEFDRGQLPGRSRRAGGFQIAG